MERTIAERASKGARSAPAPGRSDCDKASQVVLMVVDIKIKRTREMLQS